jgi:nickel/cobalt exporter
VPGTAERPARLGGRRRLWRCAGVLAAASALVLISAPGASAHPLGNFTVNHYDGLHLYADHVTDRGIEDVAEIPTLQRQGLIDTDGNGRLSDAERAAYAGRQCQDMARSVSVVVGGRRVPFTVTSSSYVERPGAIHLTAARLECELTGPAEVSGRTGVQVDSSWDGAGVGWHEITAVGNGVALNRSPFQASSISEELRSYPNNLLSSPVDVRSGSFDVTPGAGTSTYQAAKDLPVAGFLVRKLNGLATAFNDTVGTKHLTLGVGLLAIVLSVLLGAGHAFLPGHGKTIMAAYLVGRRGRLRDVVTVGATVTITHTAGVLVLGLAISTTSAFAPTAAEQYLGVVSGLIVAGVGVGLLVSALRRRRTPGVAGALRVAPDVGEVVHELHLDALDAVSAAAVLHLEGGSDVAVLAPAPSHPHKHDHPHEHDHAHEHDHPDGHGHPDEHDHPREHDPAHEHAPDALKHGGHEQAGHEHGHHEHNGPGRAVPVHDHGPGGHSHGLGRRHSHTPSEGGFSRGGLVGLGVAGGLVPSPSALLVLLAATALGRTVFGVVLVLGYGLGMAAALSAAGLLLVKLRGRLDRYADSPRLARAEKVLAALPVLTALLVLAVGTGLVLRAIGGTV